MQLNLGLVLPCFNEQEVIEQSISKLSQNLLDLSDKQIISDFCIYCVDDGSSDDTWTVIYRLATNNPKLKGIKLSHNVGHQNALIAGIETAITHCDAIITMDADLQDDIGTIDKMIKRFNAGNDIVYGVRTDRDSDTFLKNKTASLFYKIMSSFGTGTISNHADFRLMSKRASLFLLEFGERNIFLRGIVPSIGLKSDIVYYKRGERKLGISKYPFTKMVNFAVEGITSFSIRPIRMIFLAGVISLFCTLSISIYVALAILAGRSYPGWASLMLSLWFIGSVIMIALGIIGEYIGKIYLEVKKRPRYFIEKTTDNITNNIK